MGFHHHLTSVVGRPGKMPHGEHVSSEERVAVLVLAEENQTVSTISVRTGRARSTVRKIIESGSVRGGARRPGPKSKLTEPAYHVLIRKARTGRYSARELQGRYAPMLTVRRVQQLLAAVSDLSWERAEKPRHSPQDTSLSA